MTGRSNAAAPSMSDRHHIALHLARRWFAFFEAPGGLVNMAAAGMRVALQLETAA